MEWTSPSGWPMRVADREPTTRRFTNLYGKRVGMNIADQPMVHPECDTSKKQGIGCQRSAQSMLHSPR